MTGAAHCALAPYWAKKLGKTEMTGYQASRRGGVVGVRVAGDRVALRGQAVTVVSGRLLQLSDRRRRARFGAIPRLEESGRRRPRCA